MLSAVKWRTESEPFGVSQGRMGGGPIAPTGRKALRAAAVIRRGVQRASGAEVGVADGPTIGSSGGAGGGACIATGAVDDGSARGRLGRASGSGGNSML